jgi:hypothetical protein
MEDDGVSWLRGCYRLLHPSSPLRHLSLPISESVSRLAFTVVSIFALLLSITGLRIRARSCLLLGHKEDPGLLPGSFLTVLSG